MPRSLSMACVLFAYKNVFLASEISCAFPNSESTQQSQITCQSSLQYLDELHDTTRHDCFPTLQIEIRQRREVTDAPMRIENTQ